MNIQNERPAREAPLIYRQVAFDLPSFERLKDEQRRLEKELARIVTNSEALCSLIQRAPLK